MRDGLPAFLTVEEAAERLRIGRTLAYQLARRYRTTGGADGLPVVAFGGTLRVPRAKLEELAGGPIDEAEPIPVVEPVPVADVDTRSNETPAPPTRARRSRNTTRSNAQAALPFAAPDAS